MVIDTHDVLSKIDPEHHKSFIKRIREAEHPDGDKQPTHAFYTEAYYGLDGQLLHSKDYYNHVPAELAPHVGPTDQLLGFDPDTNTPPNKEMYTSSTTVHAEASAQVTPDPELAKLIQSGVPFIKVGYVQQMPCMRCMACMAVGGVNALFIDEEATTAEFNSRRDIYQSGTLGIARDSQMIVRTLSPEGNTTEAELKKIWRNHEQHLVRDIAHPERRYIYPFENENDIVTALQLYEDDHTPLNPVMDYVAATTVPQNGEHNTWLAKPNLPPGISNSRYRKYIKSDEFAPDKDKYSRVIPPATILMIMLKNRGIDPRDLTIAFSKQPNFRDIINTMGGGILNFRIPLSPQTMQQVEQLKTLSPEQLPTLKADYGKKGILTEYPDYVAYALLKHILGDRLELTLNENLDVPPTAEPTASSGGGENAPPETHCEHP